MRGFMGLVNQSTFCLSTETRKLVEKSKGTLKSTRQWEWSKDNDEIYATLKVHIVSDCEKGIKRLTSHGDTPLVIISDWSKAGSGFTLYEVTCDDPKKLNVKHLIMASSSSVYGANKKIPFKEIDKTETQLSIYAATKNQMKVWLTLTQIFGKCQLRC